MPSSTSKIPLPKSALVQTSSTGVTSPTRSIGDPVMSPQSRIPTVKGLRSPVSDISFSTVRSSSGQINKENISGDAVRNPTNGRKSRIPDIRTRLSPGKEILDLDISCRSDRAAKSSGSNVRLPTVSKGSTTPSRIPTTPSRLPVVPSSPARVAGPVRTGRQCRKSSVESLSGEELEWDGKEFLPGSSSPYLAPSSSSPAAFPESTPSSSSSPPPPPPPPPHTASTSSSSNSLSSSSSSSPHKRGRDPEIPPSKMRRTSPDGESVSPSKTRRPSPSKIPVADVYGGSYVPGRVSNSSSNEDFMTPKGQPRDHWTQDRAELIKPSPSVQSEMFATAPESEDESGAGECLAPCEGREGFLPCESLARDSCPRDSFESLARNSQPVRCESLARDSPPVSQAPVTPRSRLPAPTHSPSRNIPQLNWSISREESPTKPNLDPSLRSTVSASRLPDPKPRDPDPDPDYRSSSHSTSRLPFVPLKEGSSSCGSGSTDSDSSEGGKRRQKTYEAFVMTGDRMINLARTPANVDFQSKYYKTSSTSSSRILPLDLKLQDSEESGPSCSLPGSPREDVGRDHSRSRDTRASMVRNSKSEDQLAAYEELCLADSEEDQLTSSCHTLLHSHPDTQNTGVTLGKGSSTEHLLSPQQSEDTTSPDFSTSSLISCSEHYNGESLLDNMSPQSPSSPDTPEWSLIANGESFHKDLPPTRKHTSDGEESLISSRDNRIIITINHNTEVVSPNREEVSSPGSSGGTLTPERGHPPQPQPQPQGSPPPLYSSPTSLGQGSSEEESDMDSLHSYHPPVKVVDIPSAHRLAKRLYYLEGFRKSDISRHLSKNNEFSRAVAEEYCRLFLLTGLTLDQALRLFLGQFCLTGETQDRERVLLHFSRRYLDCNPGLKGETFLSHDAVHTLTCAIMLLNTDLHNEALQQRKMTPEEFVENLADLNDGQNFPEWLLRQVYTAIQEAPIEWVQDDVSDCETVAADSPGPSPAQEGSLQSNVSFTEQVGGINPFLTLPDPDTAVDYKRGYVMRKSCFDPNYKKTKMGKRSWKMFYLTLRDLVLFCHKDEKTAAFPASFESPQSAVRLHHSLALAASDYSKKQFVFRLKTCDRAEYLFQTSDQKELETWVETVNTVVARYSSPPLPAPCSNNAKQFQRPLYPSSRTKLSLTEQLQSHRDQVSELGAELSQHGTNSPAKGAKSMVWNSWREKGDFLQSELVRYTTYIKVLETIISKQGSSQLVSSPLKVITS